MTRLKRGRGAFGLGEIPSEAFEVEDSSDGGMKTWIRSDDGALLKPKALFSDAFSGGRDSVCVVGVDEDEDKN